MTRKTLITFVSVFMAASLPMTSAAQAGKKTAIGLGIIAGAVILGAAANASKNNQRKAQARSRAKAKAQARARARAKAGAKKRAYAAKKKKAAQRRAYAAAKKKKAAQHRAYAAAKKKKAAQQQRVAATEANARAEAEAQAKVDAEKTEGAFVDAPSTAALLTSHDIAEDTNEVKTTGDATEVAVVNEADTDTTETTPVVENSDGGEGNCKRFIPAVGLTVSVGC